MIVVLFFVNAAELDAVILCIALHLNIMFYLSSDIMYTLETMKRVQQ